MTDFNCDTISGFNLLKSEAEMLMQETRRPRSTSSVSLESLLAGLGWLARCSLQGSAGVCRGPQGSAATI